MNVSTFARILIRRGWLAVALAGVGGAAGLLVAVTQTPVYEAVTRVVVRPKRAADLGQTQAIKESMRSYMADIATLDMAAAASARLASDPRCQEFNLDANRLLYRVLGVGSDENTYEIQIKARSTDQAEAVCVSEKWAEAFVDRRDKANRQLDPLDRIVTEQRDLTTVGRVWPRKKLLVLAATVLGLVLGLGVLLALEYVESGVVRSPAEAEDWLGAPVLGAIPPGAGRSTSGGALRLALSESTQGLHRLKAAMLPVLLFGVLGAGSAYALSELLTPIYRARTRIAVEPARGSDWGQTQGIRETMRGFSEDIKTRRMAAQVSERLQLDLPPEGLLERLNVAPDEAIYEVHVDYRHPDPEVAAEISRTWAGLFVEERARANLELDQRDRILTSLRDQTSTELWAPKKVPNTLAGGVLGVLLGAAAVVIIQLTKRSYIITPDDVDRTAAVPVVAVIPPAGDEPVS